MPTAKKIPKIVPVPAKRGLVPRLRDVYRQVAAPYPWPETTAIAEQRLRAMTPDLRAELERRAVAATKEAAAWVEALEAFNQGGIQLVSVGGQPVDVWVPGVGSLSWTKEEIE